MLCRGDFGIGIGKCGYFSEQAAYDGARISSNSCEILILPGEKKGDFCCRFPRVDLDVVGRSFHGKGEDVIFREILDAESLTQRLRGQAEDHIYVIFHEINVAPHADVKGISEEDFCSLDICNALLNAEVDRCKPEGKFSIFVELVALQ